MVKRIKIGAERRLIPRADSTELDPAVYMETGFFVVRKVIPQPAIKMWQSSWERFYDEKLSVNRQIDPFNPVHVHEAAPKDLAEVHKCPELLDVMERLYPDLALFTQRFVIKSHDSRAPVFVHHDFAYDYGWPEKTTVFVPLSASNQQNGGISFFPGTHHFGYLGDAGEVNVDMLSPDWPRVCPELEPGDIALCHTCTWHYSPEHVGGPDRVLIQATFQPASDPSSVVCLRGRKRPRYRLAQIARDRFFARSRSSRLRELQREVDEITSESAG